MGLWYDPEGRTREAEATAPQAIATFEEVGDERGLAHAWSLSVSRTLAGRISARRRRHGGRQQRTRIWRATAGTSWRAPRGSPSRVGLSHTRRRRAPARCREVLESVEGDKKATSSCPCWLQACSRPAWPRRRGAHAHRAGSSASRGGRLTVWVSVLSPSSPVGSSCSQTTHPRQSES